MKLLSHVLLFVTPWTVACQAPPSMGFYRQEYWSELPFPSPGDLPNPGSNLGLLHCRHTLSHQGSAIFYNSHSESCEVISHHGFDLPFPDDQWCWASFHVPVGYLYIFFRKKSLFRSFVQFLIGLFVFINRVLCALCNFGY